MEKSYKEHMDTAFAPNVLRMLDMTTQLCERNLEPEAAMECAHARENVIHRVAVMIGEEVDKHADDDTLQRNMWLVLVEAVGEVFMEQLVHAQAAIHEKMIEMGIPIPSVQGGDPACDCPVCTQNRQAQILQSELEEEAAKSTKN
jgi:hypothetical protein